MSYQAKEVIAATGHDVEAYAAEALELLKEFSTIDCGTGDVAGNARVVEILDQLLSRIEGIQIEHVEFEGYGKNILARVNPGNPNGKIVLNGHMDTVFEQGDAAAHPFRVEGDRAYGLGIVDCKGGLLVAILSVLAMQKAGMLPDREIVFAFGCDEETGTPVSREFYHEAAEGAEMAFVFEPGRETNGVLTSRKGVLHYLIEVQGKRAHAGNNYQDGRSAVVELSSRILKLYEQNDHVNKVQFNIAMIEDGKTPMGVVPDYASAKVEIRVRNEAEIAYVEQAMQSLTKEPYIDGCTTTTTCVKKLPPMVLTEGNHALYEKIAEVGRELGMELPEQTSGGCGDASIFSSMGIATVDALGPYMYNIHSFNESMRISSIEERIKLFCAILGAI